MYRLSLFIENKFPSTISSKPFFFPSTTVFRAERLQLFFKQKGCNCFLSKKVATVFRAEKLQLFSKQKGLFSEQKKHYCFSRMVTATAICLDKNCARKRKKLTYKKYFTRKKSTRKNICLARKIISRNCSYFSPTLNLSYYL